jgi:hypothetical protein
LAILENCTICLDTVFILRFYVPRIRQPSVFASLVSITFASALISTIASLTALFLGLVTIMSSLGILIIYLLLAI